MGLYIIETLDTLNEGRVKINRNFEVVTTLSGDVETLTARMLAVEEQADENEVIHEHFDADDRIEVGTYCY